jgi:hypothetical protein
MVVFEPMAVWSMLPTDIISMPVLLISLILLAIRFSGPVGTVMFLELEPVTIQSMCGVSKLIEPAL